MSEIHTQTVTITVERDGLEHDVQVEFEYHRAHRGARDSLGGVRGAGPPLEQDEPEELEFVGATLDGVAFELTDGERERVEQKAWDERGEK